MKARTILRLVPVVAVALAAALSVQALASGIHANHGGRKCPRGVQACSASQVGQPCDPSNLNVLCSAQSNGSYCCLAYAP
jgi:hypothetical protein